MAQAAPTHSAEMAVPVVDFSACGLQRADVDVEDMRSAARELHAAFTQVGLVFLQNSGISPKEVRRRSSRRRTTSPGQDSTQCVCVCVRRSAGFWILARGSSSCRGRISRSSAGAASPTPTTAGCRRSQRGRSLMLLLLLLCNNLQELGRLLWKSLNLKVFT